MAQPRILLDMDEVLADFTGGACCVHGWTPEQLQAQQPIGVWGIAEPMRLTEEEFWAPIVAAGKPFWVGLDELPWARSILDLVRSVTDDWFIVSRPGWDADCYSGKAVWLKGFFGNYKFDRFVLTAHKHLLACPGTILIDDSEDNVEQFIEAGGYGILFPCRHNKLHQYAYNPVGYLTQFFKGASDAPAF